MFILLFSDAINTINLKQWQIKNEEIYLVRILKVSPNVFETRKIFRSTFHRDCTPHTACRSWYRPNRLQSIKLRWAERGDGPRRAARAHPASSYYTRHVADKWRGACAAHGRPDHIRWASSASGLPADPQLIQSASKSSVRILEVQAIVPWCTAHLAVRTSTTHNCLSRNTSVMLRHYYGFFAETSTVIDKVNHIIIRSDSTLQKT